MIVYVDPLSGGHHAECLVFFSRVFLRLGLPFEAHVPTESWERACALMPEIGRIRFVAEDGLQGKGSTLAKIRKLRSLQRASERRHVDLVFFAIVDPFILPLAITKLFGAFRVPWSGIFIRDSFSVLGDAALGRSDRLKARIKLSLLRFSSALGKGLVTLSRTWSAKMPVPVYLLPDSLSEIDRQISMVTLKDVVWPTPPPGHGDERLRLLLFGAISERKGAVELLEALSRLSDAELGKLSVSIVGDCSDAYYADMLNHAGPVQERGGKVSLSRGYAAPADLLQRLLDTDIIAAPYRGHVGSSAVPALAAQLGRPVLGPAEFQFGQEMREFDLGLIIEDRSIDALVKALRTLIEQPPIPSEGMRRMASLRNYPTAQAAAAQIISSLLGTPQGAPNRRPSGPAA